jgi:hypothetical protein
MMRSIIDGPIRGSFSMWLPVLYFIMAILTPMADKPEDRLMMKGVDVTPHNLAQEVAEEHTHADVIQPQKTGASGCLAAVLKAFVLLFKTFLVLIGLLVMLVVFTGVAVMVLLLVSPALFGDDRFARLYRSSVSPEMMVLCLVGLVGLMAISAYCVIHALMSKRQKVEPMSLVQRLVWVVLWMVCLLTACISGVAMMARFSHAEDKLDEMEEQAYVKANTHDGVFIERDDWDYLSKGGWFLVEPAGGTKPLHRHWRALFGQGRHALSQRLCRLGVELPGGAQQDRGALGHVHPDRDSPHRWQGSLCVRRGRRQAVYGRDTRERKPRRQRVGGGQAAVGQQSRLGG